MSEPSKIAIGVRRGISLRCPQCGRGHLFGRFLEVCDRCEICGADNTLYPSDDAPPYLTLILVGHIFAPAIFWLDATWQPSLWSILAVSLPAMAAVTLAMLPSMKGAVVGFAWATGVTRETARQ
jgi:uncharacterized protein (DUF983 family)